MKPSQRRPFAKQLRVNTCTEEQIKSIVLPVLNFTAYCISINTPNELPAIESMLAALQPAKIELARILANALQKVVFSENLNSISVEIIPIGGYFKISVTDGYGFTAQKYNLVLTEYSRLPLLMKSMQTMDSRFEDACDKMQRL